MGSNFGLSKFERSFGDSSATLVFAVELGESDFFVTLFLFWFCNIFNKFWLGPILLTFVVLAAAHILLLGVGGRGKGGGGRGGGRGPQSRAGNPRRGLGRGPNDLPPNAPEGRGVKSSPVSDGSEINIKLEPTILLALKPEAKYLGSKKHGINWKEGAATAKKENVPQGQWGSVIDLDFAGRQAATLPAGKGGYFELPAGSSSKVYLPDGTVKEATHIWVRNNGTGTFHGYPLIK